jgi:apolipoprotein D and lipocalin family protein
MKQETSHSSCVENNPNVRIIHNVYNGPSVDVFFQKTDKHGKNKDKENIFALNLLYKDITAYSNILTGYYNVIVKSNGTKIISNKFKFSQNCTYTLTINGNLSITDSFAIFKYKDFTGCSKPGKTNLTFIHGLYGAGSVDIYVNDTTKPKLTNVMYGNGGSTYAKVGQVSIPGGENNFISILVKSGTNTVVDIPNFYAVNGGNYTIIVSGDINISPAVITTISAHNNKGQCQVLQKDFCVEKYMGKWWQIGAIPLEYSQGCVRSEANYTQLIDRINVYNICYKDDGTILKPIVGSAIAYKCNPAELIVSFPPIPTPVNANYLIHSTDYVNYAVVGSPTLSSCYILARKKTMCAKEYNKLIKYCENLGYNTNKIIADKNAVVQTC